jgi:hypothetical protein
MKIDRSKPLEIHKFPSMIDKVAELKKLYATEAAPSYSATEGEFTYECAALNTLPAILDILGDIEPGDAAIMANLLKEDCVFGEAREVLRRYQAMAREMEEEHL